MVGPVHPAAQHSRTATVSAAYRAPGRLGPESTEAGKARGVMSEDLRCPRCAETEDLTGSPVDGDIQVTCQTCGARWLRGGRRCRTCGGTAVVEKPQAISRHPRGNQHAIVGGHRLQLCPTCDEDATAAADPTVALLLAGHLQPATSQRTPDLPMSQPFSTSHCAVSVASAR